MLYISWCRALHSVHCRLDLKKLICGTCEGFMNISLETGGWTLLDMVLELSTDLTCT